MVWHNLSKTTFILIGALHVFCMLNFFGLHTLIHTNYFHQVTEIPDWMFDYNSGRLQQIEAYSQVTEISDWMFDETVAGYNYIQVIFSGYGNTRFDVMTITEADYYEANSLVTETPDWMFDYNSGRLPGPGLAVWFPA